jgi:hypothetical protein
VAIYLQFVEDDLVYSPITDSLPSWFSWEGGIASFKYTSTWYGRNRPFVDFYLGLGWIPIWPCDWSGLPFSKELHDEFDSRGLSLSLPERWRRQSGQ